MSCENEIFESSEIENTMSKDPRSVDSGRQWIESMEDYEKAKAIVAHLSEAKDLGDDRSKVLASALLIVKNHRHSIQQIQQSIAGKNAE
jgi:hypothetical protein